MTLKVFLGPTLRAYVPDYDYKSGYHIDIPSGTTIRKLVRKIGLPEKQIALIIVNGHSSSWETILVGDERVTLFPIMGGG